MTGFASLRLNHLVLVSTLHQTQYKATEVLLYFLLVLKG